MPSQYRRVEIAPAYRLLVRRVSGSATRPDHIMVRTRSRPPFEVPAERWDEGSIEK